MIFSIVLHSRVVLASPSMTIVTVSQRDNTTLAIKVVDVSPSYIVTIKVLQKNEVNIRFQKWNLIVKEKQKNEVQSIMSIIKVACTNKCIFPHLFMQFSLYIHTPYLSELDFSNSPVWCTNIFSQFELDFYCLCSLQKSSSN